MGMGFSKEQITLAFSKVSETSQGKDISSLWPTVLCQLREDQVYGLFAIVLLSGFFFPHRKDLDGQTTVEYEDRF